ncbi:MAG: zinc ribbon domain-containing protein [Chitinispirillaceae bacterium]|jgi:uncharacterized membrane protein YvbJ|nr:zinc ribbon domain-containing protein [Chitinispirillaceae bacterium]
MATKEMVPCPHCGEDIRKDASACPHCGSDDQTGWSEKTYLDGIELPDDIDYEELRENEFDELKPASGKSFRIAVVAAVVLAVFLLGILGALMALR